MDSWTLQGDSYSFLRSAPRTFSLCHRDGTPNHVEIFDIINVPSQRSAISETTCLCDIFGDDCESPSLSSSPAAGSFVPSQREVDGAAAASPFADDLNDSSGSYHTAQGSSEGEEGFEDSKERISSPLLQNKSSVKRQTEATELSSDKPDICKDSSPNIETNSVSSLSELNGASPPSEILNTAKRTPSPGYNSPYTIISEGRVSSLSSSSAEKRCSPSSSNRRQVDLETEQRNISPTVRETSSSSLHQFSTPSPSIELGNCVSSSSTESFNAKSVPEFMVAQLSPEPSSSSPLPESTSREFNLDFIESAFESASPLPLSSSAELIETSVCPELKNSSDFPDRQTSSPFPDLRGRVSVHDLLSRCSTPDREHTPCTPELISEPCIVERNATPNSENQENARLSAEPVSTASSPITLYTSPSPVIPAATFAELVENCVSPELEHKTPSPGLLTADSQFKGVERIKTPETGQTESRAEVSSPGVSCSLSPSPEVRRSCSLIEHRYTSPSPEIKVLSPSPEDSTGEQFSEVEKTSASPLLDPRSDSTTSRSLTSSPHITGISYTVVQPEDRDSPPFPELSHLSTPEPNRSLVSPETRSPSPSRDSIQSSIVGSSGASQDSSQIPLFTSSVLQSEVTISDHLKCKTPPPQPKHYTPSPEPRCQTPFSEKCQSPSPQHSSRDPSPVALPTEPPSIHCTQTNPLRQNTPKTDSEKQYPTHLAKENVSPSFELGSQDKSVVAEIKISSPVQVAQSPVCTSPVLAEVKADSSVKQQSTERKATPTEVEDSRLALLSKEKQETSQNSFQKETSNNPVFVKSPSPDFFVSEDRKLNTSSIKASSSPPVQKPDNPQPHFSTHSQKSESRSSSKSFCNPEHLRRKLSTKVRSENKQKCTDDMAHHINRRRTPSPPLTRFTPVHIIAPEKPYRQWQNRNRSPSQVVTSLQSSNIKKETNRESPNAPTDNNSKDHWVRLERQLEMEREMLLEEERELHRVRKRDREMERERDREREEQSPEKGVGWQRDTSYRGEQVELSFNARNRKGSASRSTAPTSRETRQGLPTPHSYSESLLATRQQHQQQRLVRLASQQDPRGGGPNKRPPAPQGKNSAPGPVAASRPCRSSSSSMGSELDDADNEVKWFTDLAFHSLSSSEADYLDMYNSSHCSSTNISQPSTQDSPAGVNAAWLAYADFKGSASKLDNDELSFQQPTANYSDGLDPSRRYEMGSFECVDVAVDREDTRKVRRGVPKRQIQLKRKNNPEGKQDESSENSSPGVPALLESPSLDAQCSATFMRQHSTPAAMQECHPSGCSPEPNQQHERKSKLQKSVSLDESCSKTKMATCLIKSVLSKKMQSVDKLSDEQAEDEVSPAFEENSPPPERMVAPLDSPKPHTHNLNSSLQTDCSTLSKGLPVRGEPRTKDEVNPPKSFGGRSSSRLSSSSSSRSINFSQTDSEEADSQNRNGSSLKSEMKSELKVPFDVKKSRTVVQQDGSKTCDEREGRESENATAGTTEAVPATEARQQMTNLNQECENTEDYKQLQQGAYMSNTQEITVKAVEKKKTSLNVCLTPEAENKHETSSQDISFKGEENFVDNQDIEITNEENCEGNNKVKAPIHKVRDVRRLVKNTYNLSFKAASAILSSDEKKEVIENINEKKREEIKVERRGEIIADEEREISQEMWREKSRDIRETEFTVERKEEVNETTDSSLCPQSKGQLTSRSQPMQIQYKAICCKEDKNKTLGRKTDLENPDDNLQASPKLNTGVSRELQKSVIANKQNYTTGDSAIGNAWQHDLNISAETQETTTKIQKAPLNEDKSVVVRSDRKPHMLGSLPKLPSKEREVSTAVVLIRDGSSKSKASSSLPHEENPNPIEAQAASPSPGPITGPGSTPGSSAHSVSMLLKEKGYQADIGAVVGDSQNATGRKGVPQKHVNCLEIPLQSDGGRNESKRERTFSSSSNTSGPSAVSDNADALPKSKESDGPVKPTVKDTAKQKNSFRNVHEQTQNINKQKELSDFESVKRLDPTFPPRSPAIRRFRQQPIEVKSLSKETLKKDMAANSTGNNRPQSIEVKSIAKNSQKPAVPPKPTCKFKPADVGMVPAETQRPPATMPNAKTQGEERPQTIVVSSPTIYRKISNESMSTSNYPRKLAVSAVSSLKPLPSKTTATTISSISNQLTAPPEREAPVDRQQQHQAASPQSSSTQRPTALSRTSTSVSSSAADVNSTSQPGALANLATGPEFGDDLANGPKHFVNSAPGPGAEINSSPGHGSAINLSPRSGAELNSAPGPRDLFDLVPGPGAEVNSAPGHEDAINLAPRPGAEVNLAPGPVSDPTGNQVLGPASTTANQASRSAIIDRNTQPQYPRVAREQAMTTKQPAVSTTQLPGYTHQPCHRSLSSGRSQRTDDLHFYASDDPPSYDERESFSPLFLPDLTTRRPNRYQPTSRPAHCSCTAGCTSHPGLTPPHHHHSPHNLTPPAPPHSPGQALPFPVAQPALRPHQCRSDHQLMSYQPSSPKSSPLGPSHPPALYQPLHQPLHQAPPCPPHPSLMQTCPADHPLQPPQHIDPRRPPVHRSPQHQPSSMAGAPYSDTAHGHSPGLPPIDPQYLCGPQSLGPSYGSDYGGDSSSLYSETSYGQTPRKVLMDPETGKYFYIEVPVQPLRKMLFDPETGQYVEVLIPQQAMSHSGLYPPSAAPYPSLHNPSMYAPAPQYMPYAAPPPPSHPPAQPQPPRYPEAPAATTIHPSASGVSYRNPSGQGAKPETQNHPQLDRSYLESMYYVPTGMNASPNPTPPDYYHKRPPNLPPTGGKRS